MLREGGGRLRRGLWLSESPLRHFGKEQTTLLLDPDAEPIAVLGDGERVVIDTEDSVCGLAKARAPGGMHIDEVLETLGGACPLTGPFAVEGARRGDVLEVEIHRVDPAPGQGRPGPASSAGSGRSSTEQYGIQEDIESRLSLVEIEDGVARLDTSRGPRAIPIRPFLGTVGVAPRWERRLTFSQSPEYLGDVDQPDVGAGATLVLPVNVDGGLLSIGDAHAAQGDGEITGTGIEIEAEVELTVRVTRPRGGGLRLAPPAQHRDHGSDRWPGCTASTWATAPGPPTPTCSAAYVENSLASPGGSPVLVPLRFHMRSTRLRLTSQGGSPVLVPLRFHMRSARLRLTSQSHCIPICARLAFGSPRKAGLLSWFYCASIYARLAFGSPRKGGLLSWFHCASICARLAFGSPRKSIPHDEGASRWPAWPSRGSW